MSNIGKFRVWIFVALLGTVVSWSTAVGSNSKQKSNAHGNKRVLGDTPLIVASRAGDRQRISVLIKSGVDLNKRNAGGVTALMLVAAAGRTDLANLLLKAGARADIKDYQGRSAADRASQNGFKQLAVLLKERASKTKTKAGQSDGYGYDFADDAYVDVKYPDWFKTSFLDLRVDLDEALTAGKRGILLFIGARRCSYCKIFLDRVLSDAKIKKRVQSSYDVIGLDIFSNNQLDDVDGKRYQVNEFVTKVKASYTPTLIFYDKRRKRVLRIVGYYPKDKFERVLDYLQGNHYQKESLRAYLRRKTGTDSDKNLKMIVDKNLFDRPPYNFDRRISKGQRPLLVVFERDQCKACTRLHRRVLSDKSIRTLIGRFEAVQLNLANKHEYVITPGGKRITAEQWYKKLNLQYSPAIVFFDETGQEAMRLDSETLRYRMEGSLQLVLDKAYIKDAQLQRWRRNKAIESMQLQK
jgi:thioredoxin-related protein